MPDDNREPMELVHTAYGQPEAEMIRAMLEASGLHVQLISAGAGVAYGLTVGPMARVQIYVDAGEVEEAQALIAQLGEEEPNATDPPAPPTPTD